MTDDETGAPEWLIGDRAILKTDGCEVVISGAQGQTRNVERQGIHRAWTCFRVALDHLEAVKDATQM